MRIPHAVRALGAAALALLVTSAFAAVLRDKAARTSHRIATPERWFEPVKPVTPETARLGRTLFLDSCAHCHGADARGDEGPDLHDLQVSDRYIARLITNGIPHEMPSFAKKHGPVDITALTAYIRSLE